MRAVPGLKNLVWHTHKKLRIETGRYDNIPRDERLCSLCNCNRTEDETALFIRLSIVH